MKGSKETRAALTEKHGFRTSARMEYKRREEGRGVQTQGRNKKRTMKGIVIGGGGRAEIVEKNDSADAQIQRTPMTGGTSSGVDLLVIKMASFQVGGTTTPALQRLLLKQRRIEA